MGVQGVQSRAEEQVNVVHEGGGAWEPRAKDEEGSGRGDADGGGRAVKR